MKRMRDEELRSHGLKAAKLRLSPAPKPKGPAHSGGAACMDAEPHRWELM